MFKLNYSSIQPKPRATSALVWFVLFCLLCVFGYYGFLSYIATHW